MPDHFHGLFGAGESGKGLGEICGAFKSLSNSELWKFEDGKLWQKRFFDHIIRNEQDFWETVDYIRNNPVRKGLVKDWREWKWTGGPDLGDELAGAGFIPAP
jgi:putative transposase